VWTRWPAQNQDEYERTREMAELLVSRILALLYIYLDDADAMVFRHSMAS